VKRGPGRPARCVANTPGCTANLTRLKVTRCKRCDAVASLHLTAVLHPLLYARLHRYLIRLKVTASAY
jgi:hypothetical protein